MGKRSFFEMWRAKVDMGTLLDLLALLCAAVIALGYFYIYRQILNPISGILIAAGIMGLILYIARFLWKSLK